jgi:L-threonylcarbamoyladenylate synthase
MKTIIEKEKRIDIKKDVSILKKGGIIIYPTETQYGIGADVFNKTAVRKIYLAKKRPIEKKITWAFSDIAMIKKFIKINPQQEKIIRKFMPGPLTLIIGGQGIRIPGSAAAIKIIKAFGGPITTTSANISGEKPPKKFKHLKETFDGKVDVIIDAGDICGLPSTVFQWDDKKIIRRGPVRKKDILQCMKI